MAEKKEKQSRRSFLQNFAILGTLAAAIIVFFRNIIDYLFPKKAKKKYHKYLVAQFEEIPIGKAQEIKIAGKPVFVVHLNEGYRVFSGICTHLGCIVQWKEEKQIFYCPCHKGKYDKTGKVIAGPPPRPLDQFEVKVEKNLVYIYVENKIKGPWS